MNSVHGRFQSLYRYFGKSSIKASEKLYGPLCVPSLIFIRFTFELWLLTKKAEKSKEKSRRRPSWYVLMMFKKKSIELYYRLVNSALRVTNFSAYHMISLKLASTVCLSFGELTVTPNDSDDTWRSDGHF